MRRLNYDDLFASQLADLKLHIPSIRKALAGVSFVLRKNPELGVKLREDAPVWFVPLPDLIERPLGITYTFNDGCVTLLSIWIS